MSRQPVRDKILRRILEFEPGQPIAYRKLKGYGSGSATQKWLKHFCQAGTITRAMTGFYVRPKSIASLPSITVTCEPAALAEAWAKEKGYILTTTDVEELYRLRFQTQMPMHTRLWTNGPNKTFRIGNAALSTRNVPSSKLLWHDIPLGRLFRALQALNPNTTNPEKLVRAFKLLGHSESETRIGLSTLLKEPSLAKWAPALHEAKDSI
ncbi:DUF6088 family protein [Saccharophagus degradans]|uniref:Transcriptional regulator AbiEi antitoxin N-terminal domain-containing protein n=1 Tax=Saccharophagus degradans (strain 2-40 / ATCC 43961 / DSM 17024) TaxID=203122 RepID=Q21PB3_SACD2|nr:DUF6088 family protein [Saccharophagus degradans]ABD79466.1 hypothetical protein Sde_0202 [Saccharophagus degradans 2-40]